MALAKVLYPVGGETIVTAHIAATAGMPIKGPGLSQRDTAIYVAGLMTARANALYGGALKFAIFDKAGKFERVISSARAKADAEKIGHAGSLLLPIVGDEPPRKIAGGEGLPANWGGMLWAASNTAMRDLKRAEKSASIPEGFGEFTLTAIPAVVAIIVAGLGATVIGAAAAWRFLDPDARIDLANTQAALEAFRQRLEHQRSTGTLPPPSPVELGAMDAIKKLADRDRAGSWGLGAGVVGGTVAGVVGLAYLQRRFGKRSGPRALQPAT